MREFIKILVALILLFVAAKTLAHPVKCSSPTGYTLYTPSGFAVEADLSAKERIVFIVDFSTSMDEKINGQKKVDIALSALEAILPKIPPDTYVGFRAYGHRAGFTAYDACRASTLLVQPGTHATAQIQKKMYDLKPRGVTPITYSLKQSVMKDFAGFMGKKRIILITDGGENCDESPCTYALELIASRSDFKIDVIALDINDAEANNQLRCVALATCGSFYSAKTSIELIDSLNSSLGIQKGVRGVILK